MGVSSRLVPTRLAIVLGSRMIYLFEFVTCNSLKRCCCCKNENSDTYYLSTNFTIPRTCKKNIMEHVYGHGIVMANAMDKIRFELQNYFKGSSSK